MNILVMGGAGFIGQHLIAQLLRSPHSITVPTRRLRHARELLVYPRVVVQQADVHDDQALRRLVRGQDVVINLVGILHSRPGTPFGVDFARAHVEFPRRLAQVCVEQGVRHLVHMSALGASETGTSQYLRSKAAGEAALHAVAASATDFTVSILRPSVVFGRGDQFMTMFASLARWLPILPMAGGTAKMQPVYVGDVAQAVCRLLTDAHDRGQTYELAGPTVYQLSELVELAAAWSGHPRSVLALPMWLGRLQAWFFEKLPGEPIMSRDNLDSLQTDNVRSPDISGDTLGLLLTPLEQVAPRYLKS